jgi:hypothetical protein
MAVTKQNHIVLFNFYWEKQRKYQVTKPDGMTPGGGVKIKVSATLDRGPLLILA